MKISQEQQKEQLNHIYQLLQDNLKMRSAIKNWCITIWSGVLVVIFLQKDNLSLRNPEIMMILLVTPILFCWFLEAVEGAKTRFYRDHIVKMEGRIAREDLEIKYPAEFFVMSAYQSLNRKQKWGKAIRVFFFSETAVSFYLLLIFASLFLVYCRFTFLS